MEMIRHIVIAGLAYCLATAPARAELVAIDLHAPGDARLTLDTRTRLEWLDMTDTAGLSFNQVQPLITAGGAFQDFRYATATEVHDLFVSADITELYASADIGEQASVQALLALIGTLLDTPYVKRTAFLIDDTGGLPTGEHWMARTFWTTDGQTAATVLYEGVDDDYGATPTGSALVRVTSIPADGDLNGDALVNSADVALATQILLGERVPSGNEVAHMDVAPVTGNVATPDGQLNTGDLLAITRKALGLASF